MRLVLLVPLVLAACPSPGDATDSSSGEPSSSSTSAADTGSSSVTSTGEPCPVGALDCPCTGGGSCDAGLVCEIGTCVEGCAVGSLGCTCTQGGTCDGGLACDAGMCVEGVSETCGDGTVDEFEECDDASDNGDDKACTSSCKLAFCGDGLVGPGETCDGTEGCTDACALSTCGNGQLDPGEECEPARPDDECTSVCTDARKIIFVTSEHYKGGEIGGVAGGDAKCQALADKAGLVGEFKSWLATGKDDAPLVRFAWSGAPYVMVDGTELAPNWEKLAHAPTLTEHGVPFTASTVECGTSVMTVWSSQIIGPFTTDGVEYACGGWASADAEGAASFINKEATFPPINPNCWKRPCSGTAPIFCVEQ